MEKEKNHRKLYGRICVDLGVALAGLFVIFYCVPALIRFFLPLIVAWIVALIANPIIHFLEKKIKIMRKHGTALIIVLVLAAIGGAIYGLTVLVIVQFQSWARELPEVYASVTANLERIVDNLHQKYHIIPADLLSVFDRQENGLDDSIQKLMDGLLQGVNTHSISKVGSMASSLVDFIVYTVLTILACYFITVEKDHLSTVFRNNMPRELQTIWDKIKNIFIRAIGGYLKAHFKIMLVVFCITVIPFACMGISYSGLLAALIAVVDFLPFFGAGTILLPWAAYRLLTGSYRYGIILVILYVIILVVRQALEPKLIGDSIGVSPFQTLLFMLIGYRMAGMWGLLLGIPVGMILVECYREGMFERYIRGIKILVHDINEYRKY
jgi:sporulation integral membrane protein YtvI